MMRDAKAGAPQTRVRHSADSSDASRRAPQNYNDMMDQILRGNNTSFAKALSRKAPNAEDASSAGSGGGRSPLSVRSTAGLNAVSTGGGLSPLPSRSTAVLAAGSGGHSPLGSQSHSSVDRLSFDEKSSFDGWLWQPASPPRGSSQPLPPGLGGASAPTSNPPARGVSSSTRAFLSAFSSSTAPPSQRSHPSTEAARQSTNRTSSPRGFQQAVQSFAARAFRSSPASPTSPTRSSAENRANAILSNASLAPEFARNASFERARNASPERARNASPERRRNASPERRRNASPERAQNASPERSRISSPHRACQSPPMRSSHAPGSASPTRQPRSSLRSTNSTSPTRAQSPLPRSSPDQSPEHSHENVRKHVSMPVLERRERRGVTFAEVVYVREISPRDKNRQRPLST